MLATARQGLIAGIAVCCLQAAAQTPAGYPASYADIVAAARREGKVVVYSTTDRSVAAPLNRAFEEQYPGIKVEYREMDSAILDRRVIAEAKAGPRSGADVVWSLAMDRQFKLVNDGFAQPYRSPEASRLPDWAKWKDEAYGTTFEPIGFIYNERQLRKDEVPQTHADLVRLLKQQGARFKGKVTTYDVERSGVGFLLATQDSRAMSGFWTLVQLLGAAGARLEENSAPMMEAVGSGTALIGYNVIGSYAMARAEMDPSIAVVLPSDYTLVLSRVAFVLRNASDPNAAKLWLDFVLSQRGQSVLATKSGLASVRNDLTGPHSAKALAQSLGPALRPITIGPSLLVYLDRAKEQEFTRQWRETAAPR